jgi:type II secretory pathway pseudopilin PulG
MVVIGLLAAILIPYFARARFQAEHTACQSNLKNMATAIELYARENSDMYPTTEDGLPMLTKTSGSRGVFLKAIPTDPSNDASYTGSYQSNNAAKMFTIWCPGIHYKQLNFVRQGFPQFQTQQLVDR